MASRIAQTTVKDFLEKEDKLGKVVFVLLSERDLEVYEKTIRQVLKLS